MEREVQRERVEGKEIIPEHASWAHRTGLTPQETVMTSTTEQRTDRLAALRHSALISGGSLGHGLTVATGMALGLRYRGNDAQGSVDPGGDDPPAPPRVYNLLSDGELNEGSTWEAAQVCAHYGLDNLTATVDVNALQADGPTADVLRTEPITDKWQAFGWYAVRVDGNDIEALVAGLVELRADP